MSVRTFPFQSAYLPNFEVVEERKGNIRLFPHTAQLKKLWRAMNYEFASVLPGRIDRVDHRADDFTKMVRKLTVEMFCSWYNAARPDQLRLFALLDKDLVARLTIVQQITEITSLGACHRFRFHSGDDFFPDIYLSGKRIVFAEHVLERFSERVPSGYGAILAELLFTFFCSSIVAMPLSGGRALIVTREGSIVAFPYQESDSEYFIKTSLTVEQMSSLRMESHTDSKILHYGAAFQKPVDSWITERAAAQRYAAWKQLVRLPASTGARKNVAWGQIAHMMQDQVIKSGFGPGSRMIFVNNIPGPCVFDIKPDIAKTYAHFLPPLAHSVKR